jgi:RimJ/RimL family protein N-acetyltransferase
MTQAPSAIAFAPETWHLRSGRSVTARVVRPDDEDKLRAAMQHLSDESRYLRFMAFTRELSPQLLERATHPAPGRELQLVAVTGDGDAEAIVGGARYTADDTGDCEFAVTVGDEWRRLGLARRLLEALISSAQAQGLQHMTGYVLATNTAMLALARRMGFVQVASREDPTVRLVRRDLAVARPR